jgi:hypothetical protein
MPPQQPLCHRFFSQLTLDFGELYRSEIRVNPIPMLFGAYTRTVLGVNRNQLLWPRPRHPLPRHVNDPQLRGAGEARGPSPDHPTRAREVIRMAVKHSFAQYAPQHPRPLIPSVHTSRTEANGVSHPQIRQSMTGPPRSSSPPGGDRTPSRRGPHTLPGGDRIPFAL